MVTTPAAAAAAAAAATAAGSCNNLCDTNPDEAEFKARNAANIKWLKDSFAAASSAGSVAVMVISQANPGWDATDGTRAPVRDAMNFTGEGHPQIFLA
jgi:hypothetical protein